jgi:hypothetical protein
MRAVSVSVLPVARRARARAQKAGIDVVGCPLDVLALLAIKSVAPTVFLMAADSDNPAKQPGICSHLLNEFRSSRS